MRSFSVLSFSFAFVSALSFSTFTACATSDLTDDGYGEEVDEAAGAGKLALWQSTDGQWRFHVKSGNGGVLLASEAYTTRMGAINGMLAVLDNGVDPLQYAVVAASSGYVVHLKARNHETIAVTEVYATKSSATRGIKSSVNAVTTYLDKRESDAAGARFEIASSDAPGAYHFNVHAANGQVVLSSESYTSEAAAYNGAYAVQKDGQRAAAYTVKEASDGRFYFTITASNGQVIGTSQMYTAKHSAHDAIASLQALLPTLAPL